ncbi:hypothetical protein [Pseudomonas sp. P8_241]|uniref:hypothetical protein n=1 Tax=Pseudomonas sp. P8_241 TaxID=3043445 RepID=UPI002A36AADC|nr:hypothetical protein [Pseudomonas sp. P8_241]WPN49117.1 hypothetical protein QMK58_10800 [Pseudomonas sp. P8_241]
MNEQKGTSPYVADCEGEALYANPSAFMELSRLNRTNPHAVSVMLTLMSIMGGNGVVQTTQAKVAKHCNSTLQQVEKAIADLADAGWIISVDASTEPGGPLVCFVNPDLAKAEKPDEQM